MSPLPAHMADRWRNRAEPGPGQGALYWHILMGDHAEARDLAHDAQDRLADIHGLHMTPAGWLHITTLVAGSTEEITGAQRQDMLDTAQGLLAKIPPVNVALGGTCQT
ncbi:hypothetical protein E1281_34565 [Actinomadura sp. KC345]|uniref:hypothetical protein n=1 Tax=Actinomadura sp. KC345 TaxID=2530371 RepID=UPI0010517296|nr:hypothetical protein [Actinomadura sp. KC345]TDC44013.1 hypothetical protein E1281_34565 [Actinomadura sp. KC345]